MKQFYPGILVSLLAVLPACGGNLVEFSQTDGSRPDTIATDTQTADLANREAANQDTAKPDGGNSDTNGIVEDAGRSDALTRDALTIDVLNSDATISDSGIRDTASVDIVSGDLRTADLRLVDAPAPTLDASTVDANPVEAARFDTARSEAGGVDAVPLDSQSLGPVIVVKLGTASAFAIAATDGVTNTITAPITAIHGNVVLTPNQTCNAVTVDNAGGFGLCGGMAPTISGTVITNVYPDTTTATAIKADLNAAFLSITPLSGPPAVGSLGGGTPLAAPTTLGNVAGSPLVLGDNWFTPGVYTSITSILITGDITLDGQGDANAVFIMQSASSLTTADGAASPGAHARVLLTNGTKASNVWWQVASSATLGAYTEFQGNILAAFNITMKTGSTACGRSMAGAWVGGAGAFIFDSNVVSVPGNGCPL